MREPGEAENHKAQPEQSEHEDERLQQQRRRLMLQLTEIRNCRRGDQKAGSVKQRPVHGFQIWNLVAGGDSDLTPPFQPIALFCFKLRSI